MNQIPARAPAPSVPPPAAAAAGGGRFIDLIVIHCSASPNGQRVTPAQIDQWHAARGFKRDPKLIGYNAPRLLHIGYHYVIEKLGPVTLCRGEREIGAHVAGFNRSSIGICMVGTDHFDAEQWKSLKGLVTGLQLRYPKARIVGHRDLSPDQNRNGVVEPFEWLKTCPGFDVATWIKGGMVALTDHLWVQP